AFRAELRLCLPARCREASRSPALLRGRARSAGGNFEGELGAEETLRNAHYALDEVRISNFEFRIFTVCGSITGSTFPGWCSLSLRRSRPAFSTSATFIRIGCRPAFISLRR